MASSLALLVATAGLPAQAEEDGLKAARALVLAALPEICDPDLPERLPDLADTAYDLRWPETDYQGKPVEKTGKLYEIGCAAGAYNLVVSYVLAQDDGFPQGGAIVSFAVPAFDIEYADGDDTDTRLARDPVATGFAAETTLINPVFDPDTNTISTFEKWRGLGDAWSSGRWALENGRFVLKYYAVDPIYEANIEDPPEDLTDKSFVLYDIAPEPAGR